MKGFTIRTVNRISRSLLRGRVSMAAMSGLVAMLVAAGGWGSAAPAGADTGMGAGPQSPQATCPSGGQCFADVPASNPFFEFINRLYQQDVISGYACGGANEPCDSESRPYYRPGSDVTRQQMAKFVDNARRVPQIQIETASGPAPIIARNNTGSAIGAYSSSGQALVAISQSQLAIYAQTNTSTAVYGFGTQAGSIGVQGMASTGVKGTGDPGVLGVSSVNNGSGVQGTADNGSSAWGVYGTSAQGTGVLGSGPKGVSGISAVANGIGVYGFALAAQGGRAGYFLGNVEVSGNMSKGGGSFKIDHPLDPANKYLYHSFVESPDMMNVYNGNVTTDAKGEAMVQLPAYFEALNKDFRYQLTPIGQFADAIVASKVKENRFTIKTDKPNVEVSWQVTGIRKDAYAEAHRIQVEVDKPQGEQGKYLHPTEHGQPESLGVSYEETQRYLQETANR